MHSINIPIAEILGILDHENRKTTEGYIHTTRGRSIEVFEKAQESNTETVVITHRIR